MLLKLFQKILIYLQKISREVNVTRIAVLLMTATSVKKRFLSFTDSLRQFLSCPKAPALRLRKLRRLDLDLIPILLILSILDVAFIRIIDR